MKNTNAAEMIRKYNIHLAPNDQLAIPNTSEARKNFEAIKAAKPEILAELYRQEAEAKAAREVERAEAKELERQNIISGAKSVKVYWHDGEYLQGHTVVGLAAKMLGEIGAAKYVDGWGYLVDDEVVAALGEEFSYAQAVEYMQPANDAKEEATAQKAAALQAKYDEAKATGKPVLIITYAADCNDPREDCSTDIVSEYAMPDGTKKVSRQHCW